MIGNGFVIVVDLPQPINKVSELIGAIDKLWPGIGLNVKPEGAAAQLGHWLIEIPADIDEGELA